MSKTTTVKTRRATAAERYKEKGLVMFACWLEPEVIRKIKTLALVQGKKVPEVVTARFSDVEFGGTGSKVLVKFNRDLETHDEPKKAA